MHGERWNRVRACVQVHSPAAWKERERERTEVFLSPQPTFPKCVSPASSARACVRIFSFGSALNSEFKRSSQPEIGASRSKVVSIRCGGALLWGSPVVCGQWTFTLAGSTGTEKKTKALRKFTINHSFFFPTNNKKRLHFRKTKAFGINKRPRLKSETKSDFFAL